MDAILKMSHEDLFLEAGYLLLLQFQQGWAPFRVTGKQWSNLEPWSIGAIAARSNRATFDQIQDANNNRFLEPYDSGLIYHTFWGVTPGKARIFIDYPPATPHGSMLSTPRVIAPSGATSSGDIGYIDGDRSPFYGPFSKKTEIFTIKDKYPQLQVFNPLFDAMYDVRLNIDQWQYSYNIITDRALIKDMLVGRVAVKKYTMGLAYPNATPIPDWLRKAVTESLLEYTLDVMGGKV